ncbi:MAG: hypothetical protein WCK47_01470 [bacterium]|nr:hypothetical protein [Candidatus Sumerlaeota bacterium]
MRDFHKIMAAVGMMMMVSLSVIGDESSGTQPDFTPTDPNKLQTATSLLDEALRIHSYYVDKQLFVNSEGLISGTLRPGPKKDPSNLGPGPIAFVTKSVKGRIDKDVSSPDVAKNLTKDEAADIKWLVGTWEGNLSDNAKKLKDAINLFRKYKREQDALVPGSDNYAEKFNALQALIEAAESQMEDITRDTETWIDRIKAALMMCGPVLKTLDDSKSGESKPAEDKPEKPNPNDISGRVPDGGKPDNLSGVWIGDKGEVLTINQTRNELGGTWRGGRGHEKIFGTVKGFITGTRFSGVYSVTEDNVKGSGKFEWSANPDGSLTATLDGKCYWGNNESRPVHGTVILRRQK